MLASSKTKSKAAEELAEEVDVDDENPAEKQNSNDSITESEESAPYAPSDYGKDSEN